LILASIAVTAIVTAWQYGLARDLLTETRIWQEGVTAQDAHVKGEVITRTPSMLRTYELTVTFVDADGRRHEGELAFETGFEEINTQRPATVRYQRDDPRHFAVSWAVDAERARWKSIGWMLVAAAVISFLLAWFGVASLRQLRDTRLCSRGTFEVLARVTEIAAGNRRNTYRYAGRTPSGRAISGEAAFPSQHEPLFADGAKTSLVVLVPTGHAGRPVVVRDDFYPFTLTEDQRRRVLAAIAGRTGGRSGSLRSPATP